MESDQLYNQKDQARILPSFCFSITISSWASCLISPTSASSSVKYPQHTLVKSKEITNIISLPSSFSQLYTMWQQTPSSTELYSFYWVVSLVSISPKRIIGLKSNFIFMAIKISFQMAFKKIVKIYTTQPSIWPGFWRAWPGHARCGNSERSIQQAIPLHKRTPVLNTFTPTAMSPT